MTSSPRQRAQRDGHGASGRRRGHRSIQDSDDRNAAREPAGAIASRAQPDQIAIVGGPNEIAPLCPDESVVPVEHCRCPALNEGERSWALPTCFYTKIALTHGSGAIPALGFGTLIPDLLATKQATKTAQEAGFRHFDCAERYRNEEAVGEAIQETFGAGTLWREDLFVTTKLWNTNHRPHRIKPAFDASCCRLQARASSGPGSPLEQAPRGSLGHRPPDSNTRGVALRQHTWAGLRTALGQSEKCRLVQETSAFPSIAEMLTSICDSRE
jgi:hypothetical protein